jgi:hypothetical protein
VKFSDIPRNPDSKTLFQFAIMWLIAFSLLAGFQFWRHQNPTVAGILLAVALVGGCIGMIRPLLLKPIFVGWMILAFPIAWIVSLVLLGTIFFMVITPIGFMMRLLGHDPLRLKAAKQDSYWEVRKHHDDPSRYLKQY